MDTREILDLASQVRDSWSERDRIIASATELRKQNWKVPVPRNWEQTASSEHSSLSVLIPKRTVGTLIQNEPRYKRPSPDYDAALADSSNAVERFLAGYFDEWRSEAVVGGDAYSFMADNLANKGAVCAASIFAPHVWSDAPLFLNGDNIRTEHWRDSSGKATDNEQAMDPEASSRAYQQVVDRYRWRCSVPITRRVLETQEAYPMFSGNRFAALFIYRKTALLELQAGGFVIDTNGKGMAKPEEELLEVWTPNRCRYYFKDQPIAHEEYGEDGIETGYGFIPFTYRVGLGGGSLDYGNYGLPVLSMVESNLRFIDTILTARKNAIHMASYTSFYVKYSDELVKAQNALPNPNARITHHDFRSGTIMDFGPGRTIEPLTHPGLNVDVDKSLQYYTNEVNKVFPPTLHGEAESSGYNTAQATAQAKTLFAELYSGLKIALTDLAKMDMRHISERVPGNVWVDYAPPGNALNGGNRPNLDRVKITKDDIANYYGVQVSISPNVDHITEGTFALRALSQGVGDIESASEACGITDYEEMLKRQARDRVMKSEQINAMLEEDILKEMNMTKQRNHAIMRQRIQVGPDGVPRVKMPDGRMVGPGGTGGGGAPSAQGGAGAVLGGANVQAGAGAPNLSATAAVPRGADRGGAIPGAPQRPQQFPTQQPFGAAA